MIKNNISFEKLGLIENKVPRRYISSVIEFAVSKTIKKKFNLCIILASDNEIKKINKKFRNKNKASTCLSFPLGDDSFPLNLESLGDIFINIDRIKKYSQDFKKELAFNLIHSYLHLIGFSHSKKNYALEMEYKEERILKGFYENYKKNS